MVFVIWVSLFCFLWPKYSVGMMDTNRLLKRVTKKVSCSTPHLKPVYRNRMRRFGGWCILARNFLIQASWDVPVEPDARMATLCQRRHYNDWSFRIKRKFLYQKRVLTKISLSKSLGSSKSMLITWVFILFVDSKPPLMENCSTFAINLIFLILRAVTLTIMR